MPLAEVNGIRFHHTDTGPPPGRPDAETIVFGHGLLFSGWMFEPQVEALREEYRCVTVDWRGQGGTPPVAGSDGYVADMDSLLGDLVALLDHLELPAVHYVGLSMGGFVGMRLAARHPERVRTLTLLDTSAGPEDPEKVKQYRLLATVYRWLGFGPVRGKVEPIIFSKPYGKGRVVQNVLGHGPKARANESYQKLICRCTEWAATGSVTVD